MAAGGLCSVVFSIFIFITTQVQMTFCTDKNEDSCPDFPWKDLRLPTTLVPDTYNLLIYPNLNDFTFSGNVKINVTVQNCTKLIILNQKEIVVTVNRVVKTVGSEKHLKVISVKKCQELQQVSIQLENSLQPGDKVLFDLDFKGEIQKDFKGLYRTEYKMKNGTVLSTAVTHFEPSDARKMFPCFDEPQLKATFQVTIVRDKQYQALANMPLANTEPYNETENLVKDTFEPSVKMSTYLLALSVGQYENLTTKTDSGIQITVYSNAEQIQFGEFPLEIGKSCLDFYENYFNISYPLPKQDLLSVTDFAMGAMENWGLITFRDTALLSDPDNARVTQEEWVAQVICHELGHQWFGNLVTMKWWDDLWLNEGFATFMENYATAKIKPEWEYKDLFYLSVINRALHPDSFASTHPVSASRIEDPDEMESAFDKISYEKGGAIINMLMQIAGEEPFRQGLHEYLMTYQYSNAEGKDLWNILGHSIENFKNLDFPTITKSWITQPGYPLITVALSHDKMKLNVHQERFFMLHNEREANNTGNFSWPVPLTYKTDKSLTSQSQWLSSAEKAASISFKEPPEWVKLNTDGYGFYRVQYDKSLYKSLSEQLNSEPKVFSTNDRTSLLSDTFILARAGLLDIDVPLNMIDYVRNGKEAAYEPLNVVLGHLEVLQLTFWETELDEVLKKFQRSLIKPFYEKISWDHQEMNKKRHLQTLLVASACRAKIKDCVEKAIKIFQAWIEDPTIEIQQDLRPTIIGTGIKYANYSVWKTVFQRYLDATDPSKQQEYLGALGNSNDHWIVMRYLAMLVEGDQIKPNLITTVISGTTDDSVSTLITWRFLRMNWEKINSLIGGTSMLGKVISLTVNMFTTYFEYQEVKTFFADKDLGPNQKDLDHALDTIQLHIQQKKICYEKLKEWLKNWEKTQR